MTVHRSGKIYIVIAIVLGVLALNGGNNFHYLAAASLLGYMAVSGEAGKRNIKGASISLSFPDEIYAGTPFYATVEVKNTKRFQAISLLDVNVLGASAFFPMIQPGEKKTASVEISLPRRGAAEIEGVELSSVYPFNLFTCKLFSRDIFAPRPAVITVFPEPITASESVRMSRMMSEDERETVSRSRRQRPLSDLDIAGVRPYAPGDPMKLIHWKSSAKTGKLKSRLYESWGGGKIIDLEKLSALGMEKGLSRASGEIRESIRTGEAIGLLDRGKLFAVSEAKPDKLSMLKALALHE
jgi:uncharacterized protein (DUF58 family)